VKRLFISLIFVAAGVGSVPAAPGRPKLAVLIVVDQMRADYVDRFRGDWTSGLRRMVADGAWFSHAAYPYLTTVTCVGHATVSTGALPRSHGIMQNAWWDRDRHRSTTCTADPQATVVSYGTAQTTSESAHFLKVPTFADIMRTEHGAHVATVALKARSAIMLAGHGSDATTWLSDSLDGWMTSSAFTPAPVPAVQAFVSRERIDADAGKTWSRLLPAPRYAETDDGLGEAPPDGWTRTFPHALDAVANARYRNQWERSPYADAYVGRFAAALVDGLGLGRHDATDVLGISFSSPDLVGHAFGPDSQEIHDMYAHLDRTIGALLDHLDAAVGHDNYVVALSADHGVTRIPEQALAAGADAGRLDPTAIHSAIEARAHEVAGEGKFVAAVTGNDIYFEPGMYERLTATPQAIDGVLQRLRELPGIAAAFRSEDVRDATGSTDRLRRAAALGYVAGRSGDIVIAPKPGWMFFATGATHGTSSDDDQRVPVIFYGAGVKRGVFTTPATPADVAPTLAALAGVSMPHVDGHVLADALAAPRSTAPAAR